MQPTNDSTYNKPTIVKYFDEKPNIKVLKVVTCEYGALIYCMDEEIKKNRVFVSGRNRYQQIGITQDTLNKDSSVYVFEHEQFRGQVLGSIAANTVGFIMHIKKKIEEPVVSHHLKNNVEVHGPLHFWFDDSGKFNYLSWADF